MDRRLFFAQLIALWGASRSASATSPGSEPYLVAATRGSGREAMVQFSSKRGVSFRKALRSRGHSFVSNRSRGHLVSVPPVHTGSCLVTDFDGREITEIRAESQRQFCGHGVTNQNDTLMYLTENNSVTGEGVVGVYDVVNGYERISEFSCHGINPHQIERSVSSNELIIANSEILIKRESGMRQLITKDMKPSLVFISSESGELIRKVSLPRGYEQNAIRHFIQAADGSIFVAMQNRHARDNVALLGRYQPSSARIEPYKLPQKLFEQLKGYAGDISLNQDETKVILSSFHGNALAIYDIDDESVRLIPLAGVTGLRRLFDGRVIAIAGRGEVYEVDTQRVAVKKVTESYGDFGWENHLVEI